LGTGAIIWYTIATLVALFLGGWVAGRLSGLPKKSNTALHGLLAWALFTLLSLYLLNSAVGKLFNVVGGTLSAVTSTAGQAVGAAIPDNLGEKIKERIREGDISLQDIRREAFALLEDADKDALDPDQLEREAQQAVNRAERDARQAANNPNEASQEINAIIDRVTRQGEDVISAVDQDALVNVLVARTEMSEAEARRYVEGWSDRYERAMTTVNREIDQLGNTTAEVGGDVADGIGTAAILGFVGLLIGALAGYFGGMAGRQKDLHVTGSGEAIDVTEA
jgi:hypothetical protein